MTRWYAVAVALVAITVGIARGLFGAARILVDRMVGNPWAAVS